MAATHLPLRTIFGADLMIYIPEPKSHTLTKPWLNVNGPVNGLSWNPDLTPEIATQLRQLADDIDTAFAMHESGKSDEVTDED